MGEAVRAAKAARPTAILMDHTELPRPDRLARCAPCLSLRGMTGRQAWVHLFRQLQPAASPTSLPQQQQCCSCSCSCNCCRRIDEGFWRQSASGKIVPVKKKRKRTLEPAKRKRLAAGGSSSRRRKRGGGVAGSDEDSSGGEEDGSDAAGSGSEGEDDADVVDLVSASEAESAEDLGGEFDDADEAVFEERRASFLRRQGRRRLRVRQAVGAAGGNQGGSGGGGDEDDLQDGDAAAAAVAVADDGSSEEGDEGEEDIVFEGGFRLPADVWERLFDYQRTAVKWMWELHTQRAGGIIGDEMGLGKTIQVCVRWARWPVGSCPLLGGAWGCLGVLEMAGGWAASGKGTCAVV